jgi:hypothetical protein
MLVPTMVNVLDLIVAVRSHIYTNHQVCYPGYTGSNCESRFVSYGFSIGTGLLGQLGDKFAFSQTKSMFRIAGWYGFQTIAQVSAGASYSLTVTTSGVVHGFGYYLYYKY